jgi:hypothetical protein
MRLPRARLIGAIAAVSALAVVAALAITIVFAVWNLTWMNGHGASFTDVAPIFALVGAAILVFGWIVVSVSLGREAVRALGHVRLGLSALGASLVGPVALIFDVVLLHSVVQFRIKHPAAGLTVIVPTFLLFSVAWGYATQVLLRAPHYRHASASDDGLV